MILLAFNAIHLCHLCGILEFSLEDRIHLLNCLVLNEILVLLANYACDKTCRFFAACMRLLEFWFDEFHNNILENMFLFGSFSVLQRLWSI